MQTTFKRLAITRREWRSGRRPEQRIPPRLTPLWVLRAGPPWAHLVALDQDEATDFRGVMQ